MVVQKWFAMLDGRDDSLLQGAVDSDSRIDDLIPTIDVDHFDCNHCVVLGRSSSN